MKTWAVSYIDWFDHELITEFVKAPTWQAALLGHSHIQADHFEGLNDITLEDAKVQAFDMDCMIEVIEVPA